MIAFLLGLAAGIASPTQASINGRVREDVKSTYIAAIINFIVAITLMAMLLFATEHSLYIPFGTIAKQPWWIWIGGACGTVIVTFNVICLPYLGSARNVMLVCFGQIMTGLIVDNFGLFYSPQVRMSLVRLIGAVLVIAGIALVNGVVRTGGVAATDSLIDDISSMSDNILKKNDEGTTLQERSGGSVILYAVLAILNGVACATQVATNGALKTYAGSGFRATMVSMIVGTACTLLLMLVIVITKGISGLYDSGEQSEATGFRPWMISGGALGIVIVGGNAIAAPVLGTGVVTILNLVGMMGAGLVIDATGFLGIEKKPVTVTRIAGMIFMIIGAALISLV